MKIFELAPGTLPTLRAIFIVVTTFSFFATHGQHITELKTMAAFRDPGKSWIMAGDVSADLNRPNTLRISKGTDILVNYPDQKNSGRDLYTTSEFGDFDLALDYMMAKGSNSGIYLQGRYELQLEDTWGSKVTAAGRNGGIYEQWDDKRPPGQKGYGGKAPRQNASRAPGLWQHLEISFKAPRFSSSGEKIENAKILKAELNGVVIHENVDLPGPTRGGGNDEKPTGPLRIQGDHGAVAFRNIVIKTYDQVRPAAADAGSASRRVYPILVTASTYPVFRSFMDIPNGPRVVHAVSVGGEENVHYTYDADTGMIIQLWRGDFLDATPMWFSRGDGSSRPLGTVLRFGNPTLTVARLSDDKSAWTNDTTGTGFRPKGYALTDQGKPVFKYRIHNTTVADAITTLTDGSGISREITLEKSLPDLHVRLAASSDIEEIAKGMYVVGDHAYYLRLDDVEQSVPIIRTRDGSKELVIPIRTKLKYSILF